MESGSFIVASDVAPTRGGVVACRSEASAGCITRAWWPGVAPSFRRAAGKVSVVLQFDVWKVQRRSGYVDCGFAGVGGPVSGSWVSGHWAVSNTGGFHGFLRA